MTDFTDILPADLLPEAVLEYSDVCALIDRSPSPTLRVVAPRKPADSAIAAALELAASLMVCGTCGMRAYLRSTTGDIMASQCIVTEECVSVLQHCECKPSRWQHYRDGEA